MNTPLTNPKQKSRDHKQRVSSSASYLRRPSERPPSADPNKLAALLKSSISNTEGDKSGSEPRKNVKTQLNQTKRENYFPGKVFRPRCMRRNTYRMVQNDDITLVDIVGPEGPGASAHFHHLARRHEYATATGTITSDLARKKELPTKETCTGMLSTSN